MATEIQRILIKYEADIKQLKTQLDTIQGELKDTEKVSDKSNKEVQKDFEKTAKSAGGLSNALKAVAGAVAAAFTVREAIAFGKELNQLQREAQGVRRSFDAAFSPVALTNLRRATAGTISDLELMKKALQAREFGIPEDVFAKGLEFARVQANKLGQDVNFLTESIVTGLGRKSPLILDNLGISTAKLSEKVAKTGDFYKAVGEIIDEALGENASAKVETLADRQARLNAQLENLKLQLSDALVPLFESLTLAAGKAIDQISQLTKFSFKPTEDQLQRVSDLTASVFTETVDAYSKAFEDGSKTTEVASEEIGTRINRIKEDLATLRESTAGGFFVADDIAKATGLFKRQATVVENSRAEFIRLTGVLDGLLNAYNALELGQKKIEGGFDITTANVAQLGAELAALDQEISQASDRGIIAGLQARQATIKDRLDFLLGTIKDGGQKLIETQAELSAKFLEAFDLSSELERIGLSTDTAFESFYKDRFDNLKTFRDEIQKELSRKTLSGLTEEEAEDIRVLGMTTAEYLQNIDQAGQDRINSFLDAGQAVIGLNQQISGLIGENESAQKAAALLTIGLNTAISLSEQALAISAGIAAGAKIGPAAIIGYIATIVGFFAQVKSLNTQARTAAEGFAVGTSNAPGGEAWVGEKGPERMYVPKGARVYTSEASKKEGKLIDALNAGRHDEFIHQHYIKPFAASIVKDRQEGFNDFQLRQAIKGNKVIELGPKTVRRLTKNKKKVYH